MYIAVDLDKDYQEKFIRHFAEKASFRVRFVQKEAALAQRKEGDMAPRFVFCKEGSALLDLGIDSLVFVDTLSAAGPEEPQQVKRLQAFSLVYTEIIEWMGKKEADFLKKTCPKLALFWPGNPRLQTALCLGLASRLGQMGKKVLYLPTAGIDINDLVLDSPLDDGFTKLFLSKPAQAISCFSYQHVHRFYYLSASKHGKDKLEVGLERWDQVLALVEELSLFDLIIWEAGSDLRKEELFLLSKTQLLALIQSTDPYQEMMARALTQRLEAQRPPQQDWLRVDEADLELGQPPPFQKTLSGYSFDPDQTFSCQLQLFTRQLLERMMTLV